MADEAIVLDPSEVATNRTELNINDRAGGLFVRADGIDWGNATIDPFMAEQERGEAPVDYRTPNRVVTIPLGIIAGTATFTQNRVKLQQKVALFQRDGGYVKRVIAGGGTLFADVVNASLTLPGGWLQMARSVEPEATLTLETIPDFYEAEVTLSSHAETTAAELRFTEVNLGGDSPARCRIEITEGSAADQDGLIWAFRNRNYSSASTAALAFEAEALTSHDSATKPALTGASGGTVVSHTNLAIDWTPVVGSNLAGTQFMTHVGTHRLLVRAQSPNAGSVDLRVVWDVGDLVNPSYNAPATVPMAWGTALGIIDLGELDLAQVPQGTHRHQWQIQARGVAGGEDVSIDRVWMLPSDEGLGIIRALDNPAAFDTYNARDALDPTGTVNLTGQVLQVGGTWVARTLSDADDFDGLAVLPYYFRSDVSDTGTGFTGRGVLAGTANFSNIVAQVDLFIDRPDLQVGTGGLILRDQNTTTSAFRVLIEPSTAHPPDNVFVVSYSGTTGVASTYTYMQPSNFYTLRCQIAANGNFSVWIYPQGGVAGDPLYSGWLSALATGGTLASGRVGIYHANTTATAITMGFERFAAYVPGAGDAAVYASRKAQLTTDGHYRQDTGGSAYGELLNYTGPLPRIPVGGLEGRTTEVFIKGSRGNIADVPDTQMDDITAQVYYRPSWLFVPD